MIQIQKNDWDEVASNIHLCTLPLSVCDAEKTGGISFTEFEEQGLGTCYAAYLQQNNSMCYLMGYIDKKSDELGISVYMRSFEPSPEYLLNCLCDFFGIDQTRLEDVNEKLSPPEWTVYRLDDNNNKVEMQRFHDENVAEFYRATYEERKHKQTYTVECSNLGHPK